MSLTALLTADAIIPSLRAASKKALLHDLCDRAGAAYGLPARDVFDAVLQRERLGSTGVGRGIAIPHGKLVECDKIVGAFARLERPIEFDALDNEPVDLAFLLIAPETSGAEHLKALAGIARMLRDQGITSNLRFARDAATMLTIMTGDPATSHAA